MKSVATSGAGVGAALGAGLGTADFVTDWLVAVGVESEAGVVVIGCEIVDVPEPGIAAR